MPGPALGRACSAGSGYCVDCLGERGVLERKLILGALLDLLLWAPAEQSHGHSPTLATRLSVALGAEKSQKSDQGDEHSLLLSLKFLPSFIST